MPTKIMNSIYIPNEQAMLDFGAEWAKQLHQGAVIYLQGELGAGKTTLVRGFLRALGYQGVIKSPTYALVETYAIKHHTIHHFDFYRVKSLNEVENLGLRDYFTRDSICLIEWPEVVKELLPKPTLVCSIEVRIQQSGRYITCGASES